MMDAVDELRERLAAVAAEDSVAAGCLIHVDDGKYLMGYSDKLGKWSGIGGKREEGETAWEAGWRETMEEIYGVAPVPGLVPQQPPLSHVIDQYAIYEIGVETLLAAWPGESPYYERVPASAEELVAGRKVLGAGEGQEVGALRIVGLADVEGDEMVAREYIEDLVAVIPSAKTPAIE
jgi:hypothetical protein